MTYSLRRVLAVRFSLTMLVALTLIALWAFLGVRQVLNRQMDRALSSMGSLAVAIVASGHEIPTQSAPADLEEYIDQVNRFVVIRDSAGWIAAANTDFARTLPLDTVALQKAARGTPVFSTQPWNVGLVRSVYLPAPSDSAPGAAVIQVAASLERLSATNRHTIFVLAGVVLLGTLATAFGAFWLARSAVAPVVEVASQAAGITPQGQGERITAHADVAEYASLVAVLNELLDRADRAYTAQHRLLADVGHELRTPLTALRGEIEVALRATRSVPEYRAILQSSLEEIDRLTMLCESLLLITRAEAGTLVPHVAPVDLNEVARGVLDRFEPDVVRKKLVATVREGLTGEPLMLDRRLMDQLMQQLVDNAVKFAPEGGTVTFGTEQSAEGVRLWVEDSGPGIAPTDLPRLFDPFYKADQARSRGNGTGLGLAMAASIARLHGGVIRAANRPGGGARFEVDLPLRAGRTAA